MYNVVDEMFPSDIFIPKSVTSVVKEFFAPAQTFTIYGSNKSIV
ncbi:MAG: hypothetical protein Ct9H90mP22_6610 [Gammaproteobacteria bacterium]|nr:MAG: hypothetical protein Ct9H90mP22_6610 [Gammaproteobacteria bacterium]